MIAAQTDGYSGSDLLELWKQAATVPVKEFYDRWTPDSKPSSDLLCGSFLLICTFRYFAFRIPRELSRGRTVFDWEAVGDHHINDRNSPVETSDCYQRQNQLYMGWKVKRPMCRQHSTESASPGARASTSYEHSRPRDVCLSDFTKVDPVLCLSAMTAIFRPGISCLKNITHYARPHVAFVHHNDSI